MRIYPFKPINDINNIIEMNCTNRYNQYYHNSINEDICAICLESVDTDNKFLPCDHLFHPLCIIRWSKQQIINDATHYCPYCKNSYEYNLLSNKIMLYHINYTQIYIQKCILVLQSNMVTPCDIKYIKKLLINYNNINCILKHEHKTYREHCYKSQYFDCYILPISSDFIKILSNIEQNTLKETRDSSENTDNNNLLPKPTYYFCKNILYSIFKN